MNKKGLLFFLILFMALGLGVSLHFFLTPPLSQVPEEGLFTAESSQWLTYSSPKHDFSFRYPPELKIIPQGKEQTSLSLDFSAVREGEAFSLEVRPDNQDLIGLSRALINVDNPRQVSRLVMVKGTVGFLEIKDESDGYQTLTVYLPQEKSGQLVILSGRVIKNNPVLYNLFADLLSTFEFL